LPYRITHIYPDPAGNLLAILLADGSTICVFDWRAHKCLKTLVTKTGSLLRLDFQMHDSLIAVSGQTHIELWNFAKGELLTSLVLMPDGDIIYTKEGWYMGSSPAAARYLTFREGKQVWPVQEFDLLLNRPDKVIEKTGFASTAEIKSFREAWEKRIEKYGLTNKDLKVVTDNGPAVSIADKDRIPYVVKDPNVNLNLSIKPGAYKVSQVQVWINKIPLLSISGDKLKKTGTETYEFPIKIELGPAKNKIEIQAWDVAGRKSPLASINIYYDTIYLPDLYAIFIGSSSFKNHLPLPGPSNDVKLLASIYGDPALSPSFYKRKMGLNRLLFKNAFIDTLTNANVTLEKISGVKSMITRAKAGDYVFIYYAGHGVLTEKSDYILSTWDMDFLKPELRGLYYDSLLNLLSICPARQKLLLLNACNAGEFDRDMKRFQLMKKIFPDYRQTNGAQIIAASAGNKSAYASSKLTDCMTIFGWVLADFLLNFNPDDDLVNPIDLNNDGRYTVSECAAYLTRNISRMTEGEQEPELRQFNQDADFRIWKLWLQLSREMEVCPK
jgi:hypothetical protein